MSATDPPLASWLPEGDIVTPERLAECLAIVRWGKDILAEAIDVPSASVDTWLAGTEPVPRKISAWLEALCFVHEAAEVSKPATSGEGFGAGPHHEFIPVYAYNLLRNLNHSPILLRALFGSDDEGAVFFLVSRGLAIRKGAELMITDAGRAVGAMTI